MLKIAMLKELFTVLNQIKAGDGVDKIINISELTVKDITDILQSKFSSLRGKITDIMCDKDIMEKLNSEEDFNAAYQSKIGQSKIFPDNMRTALFTVILTYDASDEADVAATRFKTSFQTPLRESFSALMGNDQLLTDNWYVGAIKKLKSESPDKKVVEIDFGSIPETEETPKELTLKGVKMTEDQIHVLKTVYMPLFNRRDSAFGLSLNESWEWIKTFFTTDDVIKTLVLTDDEKALISKISEVTDAKDRVPYITIAQKIELVSTWEDEKQVREFFGEKFDEGYDSKKEMLKRLNGMRYSTLRFALVEIWSSIDHTDVDKILTDSSELLPQPSEHFQACVESLKQMSVYYNIPTKEILVNLLHMEFPGAGYMSLLSA